MNLDYKMIGKRIAKRRKALGLKQAKVEEMADIGYKYLSNIERGISIPSTEVIMRLAVALDTTPDEFLVGSVTSTTRPGRTWRNSSAPCPRKSWPWPGASCPGSTTRNPDQKNARRVYCVGRSFFETARQASPIAFPSGGRWAGVSRVG